MNYGNIFSKGFNDIDDIFLFFKFGFHFKPNEKKLNDTVIILSNFSSYLLVVTVFLLFA